MKKLIGVLSVLTLFNVSGAMAHEMDWDTLAIASMKLEPHYDYQANVDSYMEIFRPDVWTKYRNDEFELNDKKQETIGIMKDKASSFPLDEDFVVNTKFQLGEYDFINNAFPLDALSEASYFHANYHHQHGRYGTFPPQYKVYFKNPGIITTIGMSKDEARAFLSQRKDRYGNVDRGVKAKVQFRITGLKNGRNEFEAELTHVTIYGDDQGSTILKEF